MWYISASHEERELTPPSGIEATVAADLHPIGQEGLESGEPNVPVKALADCKASMASAGPGSEYWLP
jgi:hypothetical protein